MSRCFSHARISSIFVRTNIALRRLNFGGIAKFLEDKLVKPTKCFRSRTSHQVKIDQILFSQTESQVWAGTTRTLGKPDTAVPREIRRLDPPNRLFHQLTKLLALLFANCCSQILNVDESLSYEHYLGDFRYSRYPGVADQLRIKC